MIAVLKDGSTINKTQLCKRYGFITSSRNPDYRKLNSCLNQISFPPDAWKADELDLKYLWFLDDWLLENEQK